MEMIQELLDCLAEMDFYGFDEDFVNELLDSRDSEGFDGEWSRVYREIESRKNPSVYTEASEEEQQDICRQAFMTVEEHVPGELSEYVSDDFGLIYDSFVLGYRDAWLDKLIAAYRSKNIPAGELHE